VFIFVIKSFAVDFDIVIMPYHLPADLFYISWVYDMYTSPHIKYISVKLIQGWIIILIKVTDGYFVDINREFLQQYLSIPYPYPLLVFSNISGP
jgi:hypothetical protein